VVTRQESIQNNGRGCVGFVPDVARDWSFLAVPGLAEVRTDGPMVQVLTRARTAEQVAPLWAEVGRRLRGHK
jgi:hypothetical protein